MKIPVLIIALIAASPASGQGNPRFTFSLSGPCGEVVEGAPGSLYDDGTGGAPLFKNGRPGHTWDVLLTTEENQGTQGPVRWSWALGTDENMMITDVTTDGTVSCLRSMGPPCNRAGLSFDIKELTGLPYGMGPQTEENHGALGEVILFSEPNHVPPNGSLVVAKVRVSARFPDVHGEEVSGRVFFTTRTGATENPILTSVGFPGLSPVQITIDSGDPPLQVIDCPVTFRAVTPTAGFIRCDPNDDGLIDIADPIWILNELFTGGPATPCREAADCNADGAIDIADAAYGISHQFLGGPPPQAPFPRCGRLPGLPPESCPAGSTRCP